MATTGHATETGTREEQGWTWDPATGTYVWWNGSAHTARARWDGSSWHDEPILPTPTAGRDRKSRKWLWGSLIVIGVCLVPLVLYGFHEVCCTHDLLEADFESADGPFEVGMTSDYVAERDQGTYRMTSRTASPETPALSFAWLARSAGAVRAEVTVVDPGAGTVGVACALTGSTGTRLYGYGFVVEPGSASLIELGEGLPLKSGPAQAIRPGQRVGVRCGFGRLEGLIDGAVVMSTTYSIGAHTFDRVSLYFDPAAKSDTVSFDDVEAHLPE